jgi:multidrug resistance efflux pump
MRRWFSIVLLLPFCFAPALPSSAARPAPAAVADGELLSHFGNMQMEVANPESAVASAERAVRKLGGEIQHSQSDIENSSLNASVPRSQLGAMMQAMRSLSGRITHSSTSSSDLTSSMRMAKDRLRDLDLGDAELAKALKNASSPDATRGLLVLHELSSRERQNFQSQVDSFEQQARRAQFSISFTRVR